MAKKYTFIRIYQETKDKLDKRSEQVNQDLKVMGIDRKIPKIKFIDEIATRTAFISNRELVKIASPRRKKKC